LTDPERSQTCQTLDDATWNVHDNLSVAVPMLRLHLPPNLAAAASRNAIPLKVDLDLSAPPAPALLPALALLQRWCGTPTPPKFLQLTRAQLRDLASALGPQPVFLENNQPTSFRHTALLAEPASPALQPENRNPKPKTAASSDGTPLIVDGSEHFLAITLPSREHPRYAAALELVKTGGFILEPSNRKWWLRDRHKTLNFLAEHGSRLREEFGAQFTPNFEKNTARVKPAEIGADVTELRGDFNVTLALRAGSASDDALRSALAARRGYVESDGRIFLLDSAQLQKLGAAQHALAGSPDGGPATRRTHRITPARLAEAQDILETLSPDFQPPETWRTRSEALRHLSRLAPAPIPSALDAQLRPYQRLGAAWLWHLHRHELGGILADEMGLGKTLQALALLSSLNSQPSTPHSPRASLVVSPASLLENWRRESARFAPQLRVFVHHGEHRLTAASDFVAHDLVVTSYGTLTRDWELFASVAFTTIVADEAQHIKNRRSQNAAALRALRARSRFLLTGTPLENSLDDLRSLFEFLLPGYLDKVPSGLRADERAWFDDRLRAKTAPYILRRTKHAVAPELPAKLEQILWCELTPAQAALYRETRQRTERELFDLEAGGASEAKLRFAALTQLLRLRQICCDPRLLPNSQLSALNAQLASTKLDALNELLAEAIDDGHRVLVFSQFTALLGLLRDDLAGQAIAHCYLDGSMPPRARQAEVDRFQSSPDIPVFLISLKAGGTGLNLTAADTVVHFDPWWNPAAEAQATDRVHRIGQTHVVTSYKLIASGTVEEKVLAMQDEKRALLADVFEASDATAANLSLADLKSLLR
jgi:superfamily II DNA or RNA helicase